MAQPDPKKRDNYFRAYQSWLLKDLRDYHAYFSAHDVENYKNKVGIRHQVTRGGLRPNVRNGLSSDAAIENTWADAGLTNESSAKICWGCWLVPAKNEAKVDIESKSAQLAVILHTSAAKAFECDNKWGAVQVFAQENIPLQYHESGGECIRQVESGACK